MVAPPKAPVGSLAGQPKYTMDVGLKNDQKLRVRTENLDPSSLRVRVENEDIPPGSNLPNAPPCTTLHCLLHVHAPLFDVPAAASPLTALCNSFSSSCAADASICGFGKLLFKLGDT